jgi:hypothetical protein
MVIFDAAAAQLPIGPKDRANLEKDDADDQNSRRSPEKVGIRAVAFLLRHVIGAAFPQGMDRKDGKVWSGWQDVLEDEKPTARVTRGQVEWLTRHVGAEGTKMPPGLARMREAMADYLDELVKAPAAPSDDGGATAPQPPASS